MFCFFWFFSRVSYIDRREVLSFGCLDDIEGKMEG